MIYVLSDIHGNERRFRSILNQINLQPDDTLWILGDVIDRHPGGIRILKTIMSMPNVKMLLGNHEYMMLRALDRPYDDNPDDGTALEHWYRNGGKVTHDHLMRLPQNQRQAIMAYLHSLPLSAEVHAQGKTYKLVHAAPAELYDQDPRYKNPVHFAVWKRFDLDGPLPIDHTLIFGHTPTRYYQNAMPMKIWHGIGKIGIDCGSGYPEAGEDSVYGRLACLRLDDGEIFYSQEAEDVP